MAIPLVRRNLGDINEDLLYQNAYNEVFRKESIVTCFIAVTADKSEYGKANENLEYSATIVNNYRILDVDGNRPSKSRPNRLKGTIAFINLSWVLENVT